MASSEPAAPFSVSNGTKSRTESRADETSVIGYRWFAKFGGGARGISVAPDQTTET
jgi:hypothetical protein